jgi:hypothetical protein
MRRACHKEAFYVRCWAWARRNAEAARVHKKWARKSQSVVSTDGLIQVDGIFKRKRRVWVCAAALSARAWNKLSEKLHGKVTAVGAHTGNKLI